MVQATLNTGGRVKLVAETEAFLAARMMRVLFLCSIVVCSDSDHAGIGIKLRDAPRIDTVLRPERYRLALPVEIRIPLTSGNEPGGRFIAGNCLAHFTECHRPIKGERRPEFVRP